MIARRVDGVILTVLHPDDGDVVRSLRRAGIPFVQIIRQIPDLRADYIGIDDAAAAEEMMRHVVLDNGYTDIAVITGPLSSSSSARRAEAFLASSKRLGAPLPPHRQLSAYLSAQGGNRAAQHLIDTHDVPRAIVCGSDAIASGVVGTLRRHGYGYRRTLR